MSGSLGYYLKYFSELPKEWKIQRLDKNVVDILPGYAFESHYFDESKGIQLIRVRDVGKNNAEICYNGDFDRKYLVQKNDMLIGMDGEYVVAKWNGPKALLNQRVCKIESLKKNLVDNDFLYYVIKKPIKKIEVQTPQTTVKHLSTKDIRKIQIPLPPLPEQQKIASILSTVDEAIQKTDDVIRKVEMLKRGLMQRLLTKGIGHKEFKYNKELRIELPKEWKAVELLNVLVGGKSRYGIYKAKKDYGSGFRILKISDIFEKDVYSEAECQRVPLSDSELKQNEVKGGDILLAVASLKREGIGKVMYIKRVTERTAFDHNTANIRANETMCDSKFLFYVLKSSFIRRIMESYRTIVGTTFLKASVIDKLKIPLPSLPEQHKIASMISTVDDILEKERRIGSQLENLKRGLMQALLTGKVRVKVA